ncbi:hypothetical protein JCM31739_05540 [Faecalimonas canis]
MKQDLLVTIIVLTYKDFSGLNKTMEAILEQTYQNIEIIISDDGSENYQEEMFLPFKRKAEERNKKIILKHLDQNEGTVKNINGALELATGDIIGFLGCGDYYASREIIKEVVEEFLKKEAEVVTGKMQGISVSNPQKTTCLPEKHLIKLLKEGNRDKIYQKMFNENCFCAPATFYKKEVYDKVGKYDERMKLIEDYPFMFKLVLNHIKIVFMDKYITIYLFDGVSSGKQSPAICADLEKIKKYVLLPHITECDRKGRRLFLYNYKRKSTKTITGKMRIAIKYFDQFLYWQYKRVVGICKAQRRK